MLRNNRALNDLKLLSKNDIPETIHSVEINIICRNYLRNGYRV